MLSNRQGYDKYFGIGLTGYETKILYPAYMVVILSV